MNKAVINIYGLKKKNVRTRRMYFACGRTMNLGQGRWTVDCSELNCVPSRDTFKSQSLVPVNVPYLKIDSLQI